MVWPRYRRNADTRRKAQVLRHPHITGRPFEFEIKWPRLPVDLNDCHWIGQNEARFIRVPVFGDQKGSDCVGCFKSKYSSKNKCERDPEHQATSTSGSCLSCFVASVVWVWSKMWNVDKCASGEQRDALLSNSMGIVMGEKMVSRSESLISIRNASIRNISGTRLQTPSIHQVI